MLYGTCRVKTGSVRQNFGDFVSLVPTSLLYSDSAYLPCCSLIAVAVSSIGLLLFVTSFVFLLSTMNQPFVC